MTDNSDQSATSNQPPATSDITQDTSVPTEPVGETSEPTSDTPTADVPTNDSAQADSVPIPPEVREYLDSLLQDAGMTGFDPAMHDAMIAELYVRLDKFLIGKVVEFLPEDKLEEFAKLNEETNDPQKVQEYLTQNLPNAQDVFTTAFGEFRDIYLEGVQNAVSADNGENQESQGNQDGQPAPTAN